MKRTKKVLAAIRLTFLLTLMYAFCHTIYELTQGRHADNFGFATMGMMALAFGITYIPTALKRLNIIAIPNSLEAAFAVFIFGSILLGETLNFYFRFLWWDLMLHFSSGAIFCFVGYLLLMSLNRDSSVRQQVNPTVIILFAIFFSISCGTVWEIYEYAVDTLFGTDTQKWMSFVSQEVWLAAQNTSNASNPGLVDTMRDIIANTVGMLAVLPIIVKIARHKNRYKKSCASLDHVLQEFEQTAHAIGISAEHSLKDKRVE